MGWGGWVQAGPQTSGMALCMLNQAACALQLNHPRDAASLCARVLHLQPHNVKALLRQTHAFLHLHHVEQVLDRPQHDIVVFLVFPE